MAMIHPALHEERGFSLRIINGNPQVKWKRKEPVRDEHGNMVTLAGTKTTKKSEAVKEDVETVIDLFDTEQWPPTQTAQDIRKNMIDTLNQMKAWTADNQ